LIPISLGVEIDAVSGAVSLKSIKLAFFEARLYTNITPPPPIPDECMFMTPRQNMAAIAASTAEPPFLRISFPISEHFFESVTTVWLWYVSAVPDVSDVSHVSDVSDVSDVPDVLPLDVNNQIRAPTPAQIITSCSLKQKNNEF